METQEGKIYSQLRSYKLKINILKYKFYLTSILFTNWYMYAFIIYMQYYIYILSKNLKSIAKSITMFQLCTVLNM